MDAKSVVMKKYSADVINVGMKFNANDFTPELLVLLQNLLANTKVIKKETRIIFAKARIRVTVDLASAFAAEVVKTEDTYSFNSQPISDPNLLRLVMDFSIRKNFTINGAFAGFRDAVNFVVAATNTSFTELEIPAQAVNAVPLPVPVKREDVAFAEEAGAPGDVLISKKEYVLIIDAAGNVVAPVLNELGKPCWKLVESVNSFYISRIFTTLKNKHHVISREFIGTIEQVPNMNADVGVANSCIVQSEESMAAYANFLTLNNIESIEQHPMFQA